MLELVYPVTIPLFTIPRPTRIVLPLLIAEAALFIVAALLVLNQRKPVHEASG
ncbi:MAG: hypothetical protein ACOCWR_06495 [Oceanidesulfovibrio sp.]